MNKKIYEWEYKFKNVKNEKVELWVNNNILTIVDNHAGKRKFKNIGLTELIIDIGLEKFIECGNNDNTFKE